MSFPDNMEVFIETGSFNSAPILETFDTRMSQRHPSMELTKYTEMQIDSKLHMSFLFVRKNHQLEIPGLRYTSGKKA